MSDQAAATLGNTPISAEAPTGESAKYEPDFEKLTEEIGKLETGGPTAVNWNRVSELCASLLTTKTKDLLVGAYFTVALFNTHGYAGLAEAMAVTRDMLNTFWEGLFPEKARMKGRIQAVQWLCDKSVKFMELQPPPPGSKPHIEACIKLAGEIEAAVGAKFEGDDKPDLLQIKRVLSERLAMAPEGPAPAAAAGQAGGAAAAPGAAPAAAGVMMQVPVQAVAGIYSRQEAVKRLEEVAEFLSKSEPHTPVSFLVKRAVKWAAMSLEEVLTEIVKSSDERGRIFETLGIKPEKK